MRGELLARIVRMRIELEEIERLVRAMGGNKVQGRMIADLMERVNELELSVGSGGKPKGRGEHG
jgi:hypothetical protein